MAEKPGAKDATKKPLKKSDKPLSSQDLDSVVGGMKKLGIQDASKPDEVKND